MKCLTCKSRMVISSKEVTKESGKVEYSFRCPNCNPNDMERVKELEEDMQDQLDINFYAIEKEDAHFLIDTVKQQNEQIEEITSNLNDYVGDLQVKCEEVAEKDQRIEEMKNVLEHIKEGYEKELTSGDFILIKDTIKE